jgi:hypothetical protein
LGVQEGSEQLDQQQAVVEALEVAVVAVAQSI